MIYKLIWPHKTKYTCFIASKDSRIVEVSQKTQDWMKGLTIEHIFGWCTKHKIKHELVSEKCTLTGEVLDSLNWRK